MDKQQSPNVLIYTRKYIQYPLISHNGKEYKKGCMCIAESLRCTAETGTAL